MAEPFIRNATLNDLPAIMEIERASFLPGVIEREEVFAERLRVFPDGFLVLVLHDKHETPVGYICSEIWRWNEKIVPEYFTLNHSIQERHDPFGEELYVSSTGLLVAQRGAGLGRLMFRELHARVAARYPRVTRSVLIVSETWIPARRIYETEGFREVLRIPGFFQPAAKPAETGIVMRRP